MKKKTANQPRFVRRGFRISARPVVKTKRAAVDPTFETAEASPGLPASYGANLLYVVPRDPRTLFLYWDIDWKRAFAAAGVSARPVHMRIFRADGSIESTQEIAPAAGNCFAAVSVPEERYYGELGCFDQEEWKFLARSAATTTPAAEMSGDFSAQFATIPLHRGFQQLLDEARAPAGKKNELAQFFAGARGDDRRPMRSAELSERWRQLVERIAGSSWSGSSQA